MVYIRQPVESGVNSPKSNELISNTALCIVFILTRGHCIEQSFST